MSRIALAGIAIVIALRPALSLAADYTDYDRRAARTLYNTIKPGAVKSKEQADPGKLDQPPRKDGGKAVYTIVLPGKNGESMFSGLYRVSVNTGLSSSAGWTDLGKNKETGTSVIYRAINETTDEKYKQFAARKQIGNVVLTVIMRRPFDENENAAAADMAAHYKALYANAVENKLFSGVRLTILAGQATEEDIVAPSEPLEFAVPSRRDLNSDGMKIEYLAQVLDSDDQPVQNVKTLRIRITGRLAPFATIDCKRAAYNESLKLWEIDQPKAEGEKFSVVFKADDPKFIEALYKLPATAEADAAKGLPPIAVKVGAAFK